MAKLNTADERRLRESVVSSLAELLAEQRPLNPSSIQSPRLKHSSPSGLQNLTYNPGEDTVCSNDGLRTTDKLIYCTALTGIPPITPASGTLGTRFPKISRFILGQTTSGGNRPHRVDSGRDATARDRQPTCHRPAIAYSSTPSISQDTRAIHRCPAGSRCKRHGILAKARSGEHHHCRSR